MKTDINDLFRRIGILTIKVDMLNDEVKAAQEEVQQSSVTAGEALRALEELDQTDIAQAILQGQPWSIDAEEDTAVFAETA